MPGPFQSALGSPGPSFQYPVLNKNKKQDTCGSSVREHRIHLQTRKLQAFN
jgi:hypothetical protein